ncbi:retinoblastoma-like protein 2 [Dendropsophus ebraccatus]|uniref:retinoblastoma-like protein 2 n=1 Tax=Dendropsophus ebraccatus TaxID=150705 RepID=UPI003831E607
MGSNICKGNALHWLACALYVACRQSVPTVGRGTVEGNYVSLTRILTSSELSLIEFFSKMKKWEDMANLSDEFRERTRKLERNFTVTAVSSKNMTPSSKRSSRTRKKSSCGSTEAASKGVNPAQYLKCLTFAGCCSSMLKETFQ